MNGESLGEGEKARVEEFVAAYNTVDHFVRAATGLSEQASFVTVVEQYSSEHKGWNDAYELKQLAKLRNALAHDHRGARQYVAVPTVKTLERLQAIRDRLVRPKTALALYRKEVEAVAVGDSVASVLGKIKLRDYSQFPVYEGIEFKGLVTENGLIRWLARHVVDHNSIIELQDHSIREVLSMEEISDNARFVSGAIPEGDLRELFQQRPTLEAALITHSGKLTEKLLGIATRWDIAHSSL